MKILIAIVVYGLMATSVMADDDKKMKEIKDRTMMNASSEFTKLDQDHDASLTKMEIQNYLKLTELVESGFSDADKNKDDKLSRDEFIAWYQTEEVEKQYSSAPVEYDDDDE